MKTYRVKTMSKRGEDVKRQWRLIDAKDKVLGRLATEIATILMGKDKGDYTPHVDGGDYVVLINASQIAVTGGKREKKLYTRHSNYPGGLRQENLEQLLARRPEAVILTAVRGMLPDNRLRAGRLARLKVFGGAEHNYQSNIKNDSRVDEVTQ
jgi:large subunit ribosomal protein L13